MDASMAGVRRAIQAHVPGALLTPTPTGAQILISPPGGPDLVRMQRRLGLAVQAEVRRTMGLVPWVGVACGDARRSVFADSRCAIDRGRRIWPDARVVLFDDVLGVLAIEADPEIASRLAQILAPVVHADGGPGGPLLSALFAYLEADFSTTVASARLGIHRHTLDLRLRRIEELLVRSVRRHPDRYVIESASIAYRLRSDQPAP